MIFNLDVRTSESVNAHGPSRSVSIARRMAPGLLLCRRCSLCTLQGRLEHLCGLRQLRTIEAVSADPHDPPGGEIVDAVTPMVVALVKKRRPLVDGEDQELLDLILISTMDL